MGGKNSKDNKNVDGQKQPGQQQQQAPKKVAQQQKRPPKQQNRPVNDDNENAWMYDLILQYLASPLWRNPISDFLDEHCVVFDDEEENKFSYQEIHKKFKGMIEAMMEQLMTDIGVEDEDQLRTVVEIGLRNKKHKKYFEQLLIVDNFMVFKKLMLKRNKELEFEALKEVQKQEGGDNEDINQKLREVQNDKERMEIEHAIAMSLAVDVEKKKLNIDEDQELLEALKQSEILYQQEQSKIGIEQPKAQEVMAFEDDMVEDEASVARQPPNKDIINQNLKKAESDIIQDKTLVQAPKQAVHEPEVITQSLPKIQPKRELPKIMQEKKEISQTEQDREALQQQMARLKKEKDELDVQFQENLKEKQASETIEDRKKRLNEQRELIKKKKQLEREAEIKKYNEDQNVGGNVQNLADNENKEKDPLALDMSEFVAEQQKAQQVQAKKEELRKKHELMKKIRQDAQADQ